MLGELCKYSHGLGMAVSIISNGSLIKPYWMKLYGEFVDVLGVSVDSFDPNTNAAIGRGGDANNKHAERVMRVRELCSEHDIIFKMNTVVCNLNWQEDMSEIVRKLDPKRWKVFQVLVLKNENSGGPGELRDARDMVVSNDQFWSFVDRHQEFAALIPEPNDIMQNSYLLLDEELRFLDCSDGGKVPSASILEVGVEAALQQAGFDDGAFRERGGIYEWSRERNNASQESQ
jgi:radical S-adenosyl methionine domain-containing protein 2